MKVWEETWECRTRDSEIIEVGPESRRNPLRVYLHNAGTNDHPRAVAQLASAAPEMARVLLDVEWGGDGCPICGRYPPRDERYHAQPLIGHKQDCKLAAALRKAGVAS